MKKDIPLLYTTRILRMFGYGFLSVILALYLAQRGLSEGEIGLLLTLTLAGDAVLLARRRTDRTDRAGHPAGEGVADQAGRAGRAGWPGLAGRAVAAWRGGPARAAGWAGLCMNRPKILPAHPGAPAGGLLGLGGSGRCASAVVALRSSGWPDLLPG